jgi:hypothetical protein
MMLLIAGIRRRKLRKMMAVVIIAENGKNDGKRNVANNYSYNNLRSWS